MIILIIEYINISIGKLERETPVCRNRDRPNKQARAVKRRLVKIAIPIFVIRSDSTDEAPLQIFLFLKFGTQVDVEY